MAEKKKSPDGSPVASRSPITEGSATETKSDSSEVEEVAEAKETEELPPETGSNGDLELKQENAEEGNDGQRMFSYEQLKTKSGHNVPGVDLKRREAYLSEDEFNTVFGMAKEAFYKLPRWKQDMLKKKYELF